MQQKKSIFLNDAPVSKDEQDILWAANTKAEVREHIVEIADAILTEAGELTFSVHGAWGTGKTSFLKMVENRVKSQAGDTQTILFCWYNASTFQEIRPTTTTITLSILSALSSQDTQILATAEDRFSLWQKPIGDFLGGGAPLEPTTEGSPKTYELLQRFASVTGELAEFPDLLARYLSGDSPTAATPRKLVLVVDDLDRCHSNFIGQVLDTLQRLNAVPNLFILIGVDRDVLMNAIRERYQEVITVRDEHLALEKYIQYSIDLPDMTADHLTEYVRQSLEREKGDDEDENRVLNAMIEDANLFTVSIRVRTPRTVKRAINAVRPVLKMRLRENPNLPREERQKVIKEHLLAYNWRPFYQRFFKKAQIDRGSAAYRIFYQLEILCSSYYALETPGENPEAQRDRRATFDVRLQRLHQREFIDGASLDVPDELAELLATPPFWFLSVQKDKEAVTSDFAFAGIQVPSNLNEEFSRLYIASEQADAVGDAKTSVEAAYKAYELVRNNKIAFGKKSAGDLGNLGVNAEKFKALELAEALWRLALDLHPEHSGCMQQFASYIIDNRPDLYDEAEELLLRLQTGEHAEHQLWRTMSLYAQFMAIKGQELDSSLINRMMDATSTINNVRELAHVLNTLVRTGEIEQAFRVFRSRVSDFSSKSSRYTLQRTLADALANRPEEAYEFLAMDLYRQILTHPEVMDTGDEPMVMSNYAVLLDKHDYDDEAGCLRFQAHRHPSGRNHPGIKEGYARYLLRANRLDLAERIWSEELTEMVVIPSSKTLPERFSAPDFELPNVLGDGEQSEPFTCLSKVANK